MKQLTAEQFHTSFCAEPDEARIYFIDYLWEAHCREGVLAMPNGETGFPNLPGLLSILAGIGIRRMDVEWDGLPAWGYPEILTSLGDTEEQQEALMKLHRKNAVLPSSSTIVGATISEMRRAEPDFLFTGEIKGPAVPGIEGME